MEKQTAVLQRVEEDLARGHTFVAVQRLTTLVQRNPADLDLRGRLAAVHLLTGNLVEAGRWGYLSAERDPAATAAFERAFPHPRARREILRWPAGAEAPDPAAAVLAALAAAAAASPGRAGGLPLVGVRTSLRDLAVLAVVTVLVIAVVGIFALGLATLVDSLG